LRELGTTFAESLKPLKDLLEHMKRLNGRLAVVTWVQAALTVLSLVCLLLLWGASAQLGEHTTTLGELEQAIQAQAGELRALRSTANQTERTVQEVQTTQERPQLELIPETDPVKARRAPMKLRLLPPVRVAAPLSSTAVPSASAMPVAEIPLPAEGF
jgi:hypothetical protein